MKNEYSRLAAYAAITRLDRPVGSLLLLWPTLAALWAAANETPPKVLIALFIVGTLIMRSAGCVINDIADRNIDGSVARTQGRPIPMGIISLPEAIVLFVTLVLLAAALLIFLNPFTRVLACAGLLIAMSYPFFKRWTYLPQVVLGAAFSWGMVMAYPAVQNQLPPNEAWVLFVGSLLWIVAYDTMYAMVDRDDDLRIGVKSTAILFGNADRLMVGLLQLSTLLAWWLFGQQSGYQVFFNVALGMIAALFAYQQHLIRKRTRDGCFHGFRNNIWVGFTLFLGVVFEIQFGPLLGDADF